MNIAIFFYIQNPGKHLKRDFMLLIAKNICKKTHLRCLSGFWMRPWARYRMVTAAITQPSLRAMVIHQGSFREGPPLIVKHWWLYWCISDFDLKRFVFLNQTLSCKYVSWKKEQQMPKLYSNLRKFFLFVFLGFECAPEQDIEWWLQL